MVGEGQDEDYYETRAQDEDEAEVYRGNINALEDARYIDDEGNIVHGRVRQYGLQPDGDLVGERASGEVYRDSVTLAPGETYETPWFDTDGFPATEFYISSDQVTKANGIEIQHTDDSDATTPEVKSRVFRTYDAIDVDRGHRFYRTSSELDGVRMTFTNGATEANFEVIVTHRSELALDGAEYVKQNNLGNNEVRIGNDPNAEGLSIGDPTSLFGDLATIQRRTLVDLSSSFGTSTVTDEIDTTGSGAVTQDPDPDTGEVELSTGTTADSSISVRTTEYGRYTPGYSAQQGVGIRIPNPPTDAESEARWGYFDGQNGFYWGYDGDRQELFVARRSNGTEIERIYRTDWNRNNIEDILDRDILIEDGNIFQIDFSWYGYGIIQFTIVSQTTDDVRDETPSQKSTVVHAISVNNETSTTDPNQPISVEAENGTNAEDFSIRYGGRQFSVFGNESSRERNTADTRFGITVDNTQWTHIMSWRRVEATGAEPNARLSFDSADFGINQTAKIAVVVNPNLSGATWGTPDLVNPDETLLERSIDATFDGIGDGTKVWEGSSRVSGTGQAQSNFSPDVDASLGQNNVISLLARTTGSTGDATATVRMSEDW